MAYYHDESPKESPPPHSTAVERDATSSFHSESVDDAYGGKNAGSNVKADAKTGDNKVIDFSANKLPGYDNCSGISHREKDPMGGYLDTQNEVAADRALRAPAMNPPENLSREQKNAASLFVEGAKLENLMNEGVRDGNLSRLSLDDGIRGQELMQKSLAGLPDSQKDGAIAAINKELAKENIGKKVVRVPETNDVYLGHISEKYGIKRDWRLLQGACPSK